MSTDAFNSTAPKVIKETKAGFLTVVTVFLPHTALAAEGYNYETRLHGGYDPKVHDVIDRSWDTNEVDALYSHQEVCNRAYSSWGLQLKVMVFWVLDRVMNRTK